MLWDTGAFQSLVGKEIANKLAGAGARVINLPKPKMFQGVGNGKIMAHMMLDAKIKLQDGKERKIFLYVVPICPFEVLIGSPFMLSEEIGAKLSKANGFELIDFKHDNKVIYSSHHASARDHRFASKWVSALQESLPEVQTAGTAFNATDHICAHTDCKRQSSNTEKVKNKLLRNPKWRRKHNEWWKRLPNEQKKELHQIANIALSTDPQTLDKIKKVLNLKEIGVQSETDQEPDRANCEAVAAVGDKGADKANVKPASKAVDIEDVVAGQDVPCQAPEIQQELNELVKEYQDVFASRSADLGHSKGQKVKIRLTTDKPVAIPNYRCPMKLREHLKFLVDELKQAGVITECPISEYNSPCILIPKKLDVNFKEQPPDVSQSNAYFRLVVDYRQLNKIVEKVVYPMPRIQDIMAEYHGCKYFTVVDIRHAFYTVELDEESRKITAFSCEHGKFMYNFLPQGLCISPAVFQDRIANDLRGLKRTKPYIDDILSGDETPEQHLANLRKLFQRCREKGYKLKLSKSQLMHKQVAYLGSEISERGVHVAKDKIDGALKLTKCKTTGDVQTLLGFTGFLRQHVPYYCDVVAPIQALVKHSKGKKDVNIEQFWTEVHDRALETLKELLLKKEILAFPDTSKPYTLYTDASKFNMSAVLMQKDENNKDRPIGYWSKAFHGSQIFWSALVKEARAVMEAVLHYQVYIKGCHTLAHVRSQTIAKVSRMQNKE